MNIGIDIDDVLADFAGGWIPFHNKHEKLDLTIDDIFDYDLRKVLNVSIDEVMRRIYHFYDSPEFENLSPISGSKKCLERLVSSNQLIVITSRPNYIEEKSLRWLARHYGEPFDEIIFTQQIGKYAQKAALSKTTVCLEHEIDVLIEDAPEYCFDAAKAGVTVLMMDKPWNVQTQLLDNMDRVMSWKEIEKKIRELDNLIN